MFTVAQRRSTSRLVHEPFVRQLQQVVQDVSAKRTPLASGEPGIPERASMASSMVRTF